jgi:hypothetical protein
MRINMTTEDLPTTWRYKLQQEYRCYSKAFEHVSFTREWFAIQNGLLIIPKGYAWDGCSPSYKLPSSIFKNGYWFGTPEGPLGIDGHPVSYVASLVHDALCQYRPSLTGVTKKMSVDIFKEKLIEHEAPDYVINLYPRIVSMFGPQGWLGDKK